MTLLFSKAVFDTKLITAMYTDAKIDGHYIKLILDSSLINHTVNTRIIIINGVIKMFIDKIDNFLFEVNNIMALIKVFIMKAIQYQALIRNNWLFKPNVVFD
ncbi:hypothetical protein G9A89_003633 [Geosiphon pyriformis]|nr:hypothetical protein G9A89_003633 [Geosiphon pyriformis]